MHPLIAGEPPCELAILAEEPRDGNSLLHVSCYVMGHPIFIFPKDFLLSSHILLNIFQQWKNKVYVNSFKKIQEFLVQFKGTFVSEGIFHFEFISEVETLNKWMYNDLLRRLRDAIRTKRSEKRRTNNLFLPHDTVPTHRSGLFKHFFTKNCVTILENPSEFYLFSLLKSALKGRRFFFKLLT